MLLLHCNFVAWAWFHYLFVSNVVPFFFFFFFFCLSVFYCNCYVLEIIAWC